jgi:hypothetical protein
MTLPFFSVDEGAMVQNKFNVSSLCMRSAHVPYIWSERAVKAARREKKSQTSKEE